MIKELVQFTEIALSDEIFRGLEIKPKEGLHIVLRVDRKEGQTSIAREPLFSGVFSTKKTLELGDWLPKCAEWAQLSWMVDTNKCFDPVVKAIHSCSPFCFALKRTNLPGGEQYLENQTLTKSQVHERIKMYFDKASALLELQEDKVIADAFCSVLNDQTLLQHWLDESGHFADIKDGDYVVFYLDVPSDKYSIANKKYLKEKLFNTSDYNITDVNNPDLEHGTNNWFNGFPSKKMFLRHQTATFDISGRITSTEALALYNFMDLNRRKLFPNPLPLFIYKEERDKAFKIFKQDAVSGEEKRKAYLEIIGELQEQLKGEVGNYYLLFIGVENQKTVIKDIDFVSRFEFDLSTEKQPWKVDDLFGTKLEMRLDNVSDFMTLVLPAMFNNALVVRRKEKDWIFHWFDEMEPAYCKTHNAYLLAMKYRKAFYDFIYKSQRQSITSHAIEEILITGILDDIRVDKQEAERYSIRTKLNLLFSLHKYFSTQHNPRFMHDNILALRQRIDDIAKSEANIENDEQFAFAAGQVIDRIFSASKTSDKSFGYLEPFLAQTDAVRFKVSIANFFKRYKHANFSQRFQNVSAQVLVYPKTGSIKELLPIFLAGVFSENQLFSDKKSEEPVNQN